MSPKQVYLPYVGMEFHLAESIKTHRSNPELSQLEFEASNMFQSAAIESDLDIKIQKIKAYKSFCKKNKLKCFRVQERVAA